MCSINENRGVETRQLNDGIDDTLVLALEVLKIAGVKVGPCFRETAAIELGSRNSHGLTFLRIHRVPRLDGNELLPAIDVVGCTREGSIGHDVYR